MKKWSWIFLVTLTLGACQYFMPPTTDNLAPIPVDCGGPHDGRFTIGANNTRLMYGYPIPVSTSHFIVKVNDKFASNASRFGGRVQYICTERKQKVKGAMKYDEFHFKFNGIRIEQRLIPVDQNFNDVDSTQAAQYYRVEYEFINLTTTPRAVGLLLLIDNMIADNDAPKLDVDGERLRVESGFKGEDVPSQVFLYRKEGDLTDATAEIITDKGKAVKPDELYIGRWPYFFNVIWDVEPNGQPYTDAAVIVKWNSTMIDVAKKHRVATHYGIATRLTKEGQKLDMTDYALSLKYQSEATAAVSYDTVYFEIGKTTLTAASRQTIEYLLSNKDVDKVGGVLINGYTDAKGDADKNIVYSVNRANVVKDYLKKKGIKESKIIPKGYGELYADQSEQSQKNGNPSDRKAVIVLHYEE